MKNKLRLLFCILICILFTDSYSQHNKELDYKKLLELPFSDLLTTGERYRKQNDIDTAMIYYMVLAGKYNSNINLADKYLCMIAYNLAGQIYFEKGNYSRAFELYLKGILICEENNMSELLPEFYKNTGNIYCSFQDYEPGIDCYIKGLHLARKFNNTEVEIKLLNNLTGMCCYVNRIEEAKLYYNESLKYKSLDTIQQYLSDLNLGLIYVNEQKYDSATACFKRSAEYAISNKLESKYISSSYTELAQLYEKTGRYDSALYYIQKGMEVVKESGPMYIFAENLKTMANIYRKIGDDKTSLLYKTRYWTLYDSIFSKNEFNKMKNTQFLYEMDKNYRKIESLNADKERKELQVESQRKLLVIVFISLLILISMFIIVYTQKRKLNNAYRDLFKRNKDLLKFEQKYKELLNAKNSSTEGINTPFISGINYNLNETPEETNIDKVKLQSASKLSDEQKEKLLYDINKVMEDPEKFCDCDFSLEQLSSLIGSNSRYVSQVINETYNKNFRTYINEYRIKEAQLRLMNIKEYGNYTIKAIAESVGYKSHTNFILIFKKMTGMSPSLYQNMTKKDA